MKPIITTVIVLTLFSCNQKTKIPADSKIVENTPDTVIAKHNNALNKSFEIGFHSKSYSYYWVAGKDTLRFSLIASEHEKDSSLHLNILHKEPILMTTALARIKDCLDLLKEDFYLSKLNSVHFNSPVFYPDLTKELGKEYEEKFGRKIISYQSLNQFLLGTDLNTRLNNLLEPLNKKAKRYSIEKFRLIGKGNQSIDLPTINFSGYPDLNLHGFGLSVQLKSL